MDLSVIIVSFNTKKLTVACIESIFKSNPNLTYEIIVVDNGSSDESVSDLQKQAKAHINIKLIIIENESNLGFAKANNQGLKISKGKYKLLLNSDTRIGKGVLEKLISFAERNNDAGAVGPKLLNPDGSVQPSVYYLPTIKRALIHFWFNGIKYFDKYVPNGNGVQQVEAVTMAAFLITPRAYKAVGALNEKYFMYFEDLDYARKLMSAGLKIYYLPEIAVVHEHGASGKNLADENNQWRRLISGSMIYHGTIKHYMITFILWSGQKWRTLSS
jgi:GT2 family glycosyltransferase